MTVFKIKIVDCLLLEREGVTELTESRGFAVFDVICVPPFGSFAETWDAV